MVEPAKKTVLIYDAACPLCSGAGEWVLRRAQRGSLELLPCQSAERAERYPELTEDQCMAAMHLVLPDGSVCAGEQALPHLFRLLRGWRWLANALAIPGIRGAAPLIYRWVARHRYALSAFLRGLHRDSENA